MQATASSRLVEPASAPGGYTESEDCSLRQTHRKLTFSFAYSAPGTIICNFDEPEERTGKRKRTSEAGNKGGKVAALEAKIGEWELLARLWKVVLTWASHSRARTRPPGGDNFERQDANASPPLGSRFLR